MMKNDKRVIPLNKQIEEYNKTASGAVAEIFPGFSERLNFLIDLTDLGVPALDEGRQSFISSLLQSSRMAPGDWLKKDKLPKASTLRTLVTYLLRHVEADNNVYKVEAWLKYGNSVIPNPFVHTPTANQALIPLATTLIVSVSKDNGILTTQFDLTKVLDATLETLSDFELAQESQVEIAHKKVIAHHIRSHLKK